MKCFSNLMDTFSLGLGKASKALLEGITILNAKMCQNKPNDRMCQISQEKSMAKPTISNKKLLQKCIDMNGLFFLPLVKNIYYWFIRVY